MKTQATITDPELVIPLPFDLTCPEQLSSALDMSWLADFPQQDPDLIPEALSTLARLSDISSSSASNETSTQAQRLWESLLPSIDFCRSSTAMSPRLGTDPIPDVGKRQGYIQGVEMSGPIDIGCQESANLIASPGSLAAQGAQSAKGQTCNPKVKC